MTLSRLLTVDQSSPGAKRNPGSYDRRNPQSTHRPTFFLAVLLRTDPGFRFASPGLRTVDQRTALFGADLELIAFKGMLWRFLTLRPSSVRAIANERESLMAEFSFLGTWADSQTILGSIFAHKDIRFVPDRWYSSNVPDVFTDLNETLLCMLRERHHGFICSYRFTRFPISLVQQPCGPRAGQYWVDPNSGPCLDLLLPAAFEDGGVVCLNVGTLSHTRQFFNPETLLCERHSEQLRSGYKAILKSIRSCLRRSDRWTATPTYIGDEAVRLLDAGNARIIAKGL